MSAPPLAGMVLDVRARAGRLRYEALFSRGADLAMVGVPVLATALAFAVAWRLGENVFGTTHTYLLWATAYLFGNTSHVALTFLLVGTRRDMLRATEHQTRTVLGVSLTVFALALVLGQLTRTNPTASTLLETVTGIFAIHHTLSQAKGFWALYSLRSAKAGLPGPSGRERDLQKLFVPIGLLLIAIKWTLVGASTAAHAGPYMNVNPGYPAVLPFLLTYGLLAAWLVYVGLLGRALLAYERLNAAKLVYLGTQCGVVTLELISPGWGVTIGASIHGLEYYLLSRKMLAPTASETTSKITAALCWPVMLAAMAPILFVGLLRNPWAAVGLLGGNARTWAGLLVNATVLAHYGADAFLFRFRIPGIRKVALARLGLG